MSKVGKPFWEYGLFARALVYASKAHKSQKRKYTFEPYIVHPINVVEILMDHEDEFGFSDEVYAAALLHDTVEDTHVTEEDIRKNFGDDVGNYVRGMTKVEDPKNNRATRKEAEAVRLSEESAIVQTIKCADLLANQVSIVEHDQKFAKIFLKESRVLHSVMTMAKPSIRKALISAIDRDDDIVAGRGP